MRFWSLAAGALVILAGLGLAAELQMESTIQPDEAQKRLESQRITSGAPTLLTGLIVGLGAAWMALCLSHAPAPWWKRGLYASGIVAAVWVWVFLGQTMWPNVDAIQFEGDATAQVSVTLLAANGEAIPALLAPIFALVYMTGMGLAWCLRRIRQAPRTTAQLVTGTVGLALGSSPILLVAAGGALRLLGDLPQEAGTGAYLLLLPAAAAALAGLASTQAWRVWHLAKNAADPRRRILAREAYQSAWRIDTACVLVLCGVAALAAWQEVVPISLLENGRTFGASLANHTELMLLAAGPAALGLSLHRRLGNMLKTGPLADAAPTAWPIAAIVVTAVAAVVVNFVPMGSLLGWVIAYAPVAVAAFVWGPGAPSLGMMGAILWAMGNTIVASYAFSKMGALVYVVGPGALALWRLAASVILVIALARVVGPWANRAASRAWLAGLGLVIALNIEWPLAAWTDVTGAGQSLSVGSLVAGQQPAVHVVFHLVALGGIMTGVYGVWRLGRDEA